MKKFILASMALALTVGASAKSNTTLSSLPTNAQEFVATYFANEAIKQVKANAIKYEVKFKNGTELQFFTNGEFKEVEAGKKQALPKTLLNVLPAKAKTRINQKFASWKLTEIEVKFSGKIEVELEKGKWDAEIEFTPNGNLIKESIDK